MFDEIRYGHLRIKLQTKYIKSCTIEQFLGTYLKISTNIKLVEIPEDVIKYPLVELDIPFLCGFTRVKNPKLVFEIGTGLGLSSKCFLSNMNNGTLISLDIKNRNILTTKDKRLKQYIADSKNFDYTSFYNKVDLFFIDGNHKHNYVLSDSNNALKCIKDNGYIIWHDFHSDYLGNVSAILSFIDKHNLDYCKILGTWMIVAWKKKLI